MPDAPNSARWTVLRDDPPLLLHRYSIGPANDTNTVVVGTADGELAVISPGTKPSDALLSELATFGRVTTLVAPNPFHHLGLRAWAEAFPDARIHGAAGTLERLRSRQRGLTIEGLEGLAGTPTQWIEAPGLRFGEVWTESAGALYVGDAFLNLATFPMLPLGWLLRPLGFGPGLRVNAMRARFLVTDKAAHRAWLEELLSGVSTVIPAHGDPIEASGLRDTLMGLYPR